MVFTSNLTFTNVQRNTAQQLQMAKFIKGWILAKVQAYTKLTIDAIAKAQGEPLTMLPADWTSLMVQFNSKNWISDEEVQPRGTGKLSNKSLLPEEEKHANSKAELSRELGVHFGSSLAIERRWRYISSMPNSMDDLRTNFSVMSNMWLLAHLRQPGPPLSDLFETTFVKFLDTSGGVMLVVPQQSLRLSFSVARISWCISWLVDPLRLQKHTQFHEWRHRLQNLRQRIFLSRSIRKAGLPCSHLLHWPPRREVARALRLRTASWLLLLLRYRFAQDHGVSFVFSLER